MPHSAVPILTQPEGRVLRDRIAVVGHVGPVPILTQPEGRVLLV